MWVNFYQASRFFLIFSCGYKVPTDLIAAQKNDSASYGKIKDRGWFTVSIGKDFSLDLGAGLSLNLGHKNIWQFSLQTSGEYFGEGVSSFGIGKGFSQLSETGGSPCYYVWPCCSLGIE